MGVVGSLAFNSPRHPKQCTSCPCRWSRVCCVKVEKRKEGNGKKKASKQGRDCTKVRERKRMGRNHVYAPSLPPFLFVLCSCRERVDGKKTYSPSWDQERSKMVPPWPGRTAKLSHSPNVFHRSNGKGGEVGKRDVTEEKRTWNTCCHSNTHTHVHAFVSLLSLSN